MMILISPFSFCFADKVGDMLRSVLLLWLSNCNHCCCNWSISVPET